MLSDVMWSGARSDESKGKGKTLRPTRVSLTKEIGQTVPSIEKNQLAIVISAQWFCSLLVDVVDSAVSRA